MKSKPRSIRTFRLQNRRIHAIKPQEIMVKICQCFEGSNKVVHFSGKVLDLDSPQSQSRPKQQARSAAAAVRPPKSPQAAGATHRSCRPRPTVPLRRQARSAEAAAGTRARNSHVPPYQPSGLNQQRPHRRPIATTSPQAGAELSFQNTPQTSVAPCPRLRRSRTRRHTWSRTF